MLQPEHQDLLPRLARHFHVDDNSLRKSVVAGGHDAHDGRLSGPITIVVNMQVDGMEFGKVIEKVTREGKARVRPSSIIVFQRL